MTYDPSEEMWLLSENIEGLELWDVKTNPDNFPENGFKGMDFQIVALTDEEVQKFKNSKS